MHTHTETSKFTFIVHVHASLFYIFPFFSNIYVLYIFACNSIWQFSSYTLDTHKYTVSLPLFLVGTPAVMLLSTFQTNDIVTENFQCSRLNWLMRFVQKCKIICLRCCISCANKYLYLHKTIHKQIFIYPNRLSVYFVYMQCVRMLIRTGACVYTVGMHDKYR